DNGTLQINRCPQMSRTLKTCKAGLCSKEFFYDEFILS
ncbi:unnamed protein product, partial [Allacma fusca]